MWWQCLRMPKKTKCSLSLFLVASSNHATWFAFSYLLRMWRDSTIRMTTWPSQELEASNSPKFNIEWKGLWIVHHSLLSSPRGKLANGKAEKSNRIWCDILFYNFFPFMQFDKFKSCSDFPLKIVTMKTLFCCNCNSICAAGPSHRHKNGICMHLANG